MVPLQAMVLLEHRQSGIGREEQVPGFTEPDLRPVIAHGKICADMAEKLNAEP